MIERTEYRAILTDPKDGGLIFPRHPEGYFPSETEALDYGRAMAFKVYGSQYRVSAEGRTVITSKWA